MTHSRNAQPRTAQPGSVRLCTAALLLLTVPFTALAQTTPAAPAAPAAAPAAPAFVTTLVVTEGPLRGTSLNLHSAPVLIGRAPECTLVLDDEYVSSRHARIMNRGGEWFVEDLGSKNGTLLAGRTIDSPVPFKPGAKLRIGRTEVELRRGPR